MNTSSTKATEQPQHRSAMTDYITELETENKRLRDCEAYRDMWLKLYDEHIRLKALTKALMAIVSQTI